MGDAVVLSNITERQRQNLANIISMGEFAGILNLVTTYEAGDDMTTGLQQLLQLQASKRSDGIRQSHMRTALNDTNVQGFRAGLKAFIRVRKFFARFA